MALKYTKILLAAAWVLTVSLVGVSLDVTHASGWAVLAGVCVVPALIMLRFWHAPAETISESIQKELK
jgi:hypothetical protein